MTTQYSCELYFDKAKSDRIALMKLSLQNLGFIPNVMSIYVNMAKMFEGVLYDESLLFSILRDEEEVGIQIRHHVYKEGIENPWFKFSSKDGKFISLNWSNENMDFILPDKIPHFLNIDGFTAGYVFDNKDAWEQSREAKEHSEPSSINYPGQFKYVCGMQFMAAPLMWFGEPFFEIISKSELMKFENAHIYEKLLPKTVFKVKLFDQLSLSASAGNRQKQKEFWSFFDLDKIISKFEKENTIDAVEALNDFLAKGRQTNKNNPIK